MSANDPANPNLIQTEPTVNADTREAQPAEQEAPSLKFKRVHIIVNPASGQEGLRLPGLNKILNDLGIEWEMFVLRRGGEAGERAQQAIAAGVDAVVVYGGDGTANVLSVELGIPHDQTQAALLLGGVPNAIRALDMADLIGGKGKDGNLLFFHLGIGIEGAMHASADRDAKDRSGMMAYVVSALRTLTNPITSHYTMMLDGQTVEADGINCMITNFGSVGLGGITLSHTIDISDGVLDVIVIQDTNISSLLAAAANAVTSGELAQPLLQWQAKEVSITADPPQPIVVDGELIEIDEIKVRIVPQAVRVVVPAKV